MRTISRIKIHPLYYAVAFFCVITGMFRPFTILNLLILVHEIGHISSSILYGWHIEKVLLFPFGGMTVFQESLNRPIREEFTIACMGPIFQIIGFCLLKHFGWQEIEKYHYALLFFNLLPIIPLDGSKILKCMLNLIFPMKKAEKLLILISFFGGFILFFLSIYLQNLMFLILCIFLLKEIYKAYRMQPYIFHKFLLERYLSFHVFSKTRYILGDDIRKMYRGYNHMFYTNNRWQSERCILRQFFMNK